MKEPWYESDNPTKVARGAGWRIGVGVLVVFLVGGLISVLLWAFGVFTADVKGRGEAIKIRAGALNRIEAQERFEQLYADIKGYDQRIDIYQQQLDLSTGDTNTLTTQLTGVKSICIQTTQEYNANARKYTQEAFRSADLPYQIDGTDPATDCKGEK